MKVIVLKNHKGRDYKGELTEFRKGEVMYLSRSDALYAIAEGLVEEYHEEQKVIVQQVKTTKRPVRRGVPANNG